ncbi:hypothetical protein HPP92_024119 [Vanilla planifolia]|uniref:Maintenance of Photosystem II under High light 2 C-terminal domain-containing protein n=1 Tax=Vanilla planifolia TaxID=51239 RepID=A0A835PRF3_VANPL|nr:hypothetical protein HPP92_024119 [Vanilla planifolia]
MAVLGLDRAVAALAPVLACNSRMSAESATSKASVVANPASTLFMGRREGISACFTVLTLSLSGASLSAVLEADDDVELLEKVKKDRKKRLERQGVISSSTKETGYLQELVYRLSKVGRAIENNDFSSASAVLGPSSEADWVQNVNFAFTKLTSSHEEKSEADAFKSSLANLISSVDKHDMESSKLAFVSSASAFEKWVELTGLLGLLKGL